MQPTLLKNPLYCARFNLSIWEAAPWNKMFACKNIPDFQWKYKTKTSTSPWGLHLSWIRFSLMFLHHITNGFREVKQQFSFLRTKACRVKKKMLIYLKHFCPLFFLLLQEFWREKKASCCIILSSMLMKFAFKSTAQNFYKGEWFLNECLLVPMDDV